MATHDHHTINRRRDSVQFSCRWVSLGEQRWVTSRERRRGCSPIHARSPSATWFPEQLTCSAYRPSVPPARATGAIRSRVWRPSSLSLWERAGATAREARARQGEASRKGLARRVRVSGLATFPKELTMNIEDEILNIRTTFARIEGRPSVVYSLPELYPA